MEYKIESASNINDLSDKVNKEIEQSWRPQGGVSHTFIEGMGNYFLQAMIKK
ncbi:hypothetical protein [Winogradskyella aquimaris]|uniref:DUF1737 domain-containing protein n=1 Tax=Winogradskyella aquimaris TaxID=864074 RepID=A0ABU5EMI6_9FLAO|nr:hypothetical protein [Winogradskyella aquimaris]MDY2586788.1 hypothetical protein [Winogradskyella aquimaris]